MQGLFFIIKQPIEVNFLYKITDSNLLYRIEKKDLKGSFIISNLMTDPVIKKN